LIHAAKTCLNREAFAAATFVFNVRVVEFKPFVEAFFGEV